MALPNVSIKRKKNLKRVAPVDDRVIALVLTGLAVAGKIGLADPQRIFGTNELEDLGITAADNAFAYAEILKFYALAGEGAELNFMLVSEATSLEDQCDTANNIAKKLLDFGEGRITALLINRKLPNGYVVNQVDGLDADVWAAITKLNALAEAYDEQNMPFVGFLPGIGYSKATKNTLRDLNTMNSEMVAAPILAADSAGGNAAIGTLAGWLVKHQVHRNIGRVRNGAVVETGYFIDGTAIAEYNHGELGDIHDKRYIIFRKHAGKSGFYFNDDPCATSVASDFSSISWNNVINKAKRIAAAQLIELLNDDVDTEETTGGISPSLATDWEGDVENAIFRLMKKPGEISGVKCFIDPNQDVVNTDELEVEIEIVRKGQAKKISVTVQYSTSI